MCARRGTVSRPLPAPRPALSRGVSGYGGDLRPMPLMRIAEPVDHPDWLFELKYEGSRALAERHC